MKPPNLFLILLIKSVQILAFNLDSHFPLVYEDPQAGENLDRSSYFGYSVIIYSKNNYTWIQIGAPRANNSAIPNIQEPGLIYRCELGKHCLPYHISSQDNKKFDEYHEMKDKGWLGGTMALQYDSDLIVTCAPRWKNARTTLWKIVGACYFTHAGDRNASSSHISIPLLDNDIYKIEKQTIPYQMMGQAGISAYFPKPGDNSNIELLLGAPGVLNWKGSVVLLEDENYDTSVSRRRRSIKAKGYFNKVYVMNNLIMKDITYGDYFGYSVISGNFFPSKYNLYAASAPRSNGFKGKVLIYQIREVKRTKTIHVLQTIIGNTFGGYFGAALAVGDLNGDEYDDLLISATTLPTPTVYVYFGTYDQNQGALQSTSELESPFDMNSRFGTSLAVIDLDLDGHSDVIVGAPHAYDNKGAIVIYKGGSTGPKINEAPKIIHPTELHPNLRGFGVSIAAPLDLDDNSYPDVAIGSYLSGHAVIMRGRPIANLKITLKDNIVMKIPKDLDETNVSVCLTYNVLANYTVETSIKWFLMIDDIFKRVYFKDTKSQHIFLQKKFKELNKVHCEDFKILLKNGISNDAEPVILFSNVTIVDYHNNIQSIVINKNNILGEDKFNKWYPIAAPFQAQFKLPFAKGCGNKEICESDLQVQLSTENNSNTFILGSNNILKLNINVKNFGDLASLTQIKLDVPYPASLGRLISDCFTSPEIENSIFCELEDIKQGESKMIELEINMQEVSSKNKNGDMLKFSVIATTQSVEINEDDNKSELKINLKVEASVRIAGKSTEDSYQYEKLDDGSINENQRFSHLFEVQKFGLSPLNKVNIKIIVPYMYNDQKQQLQFIQIYEPQGSYDDEKEFYCERTSFPYLVLMKEKRNFDDSVIKTPESATVEKRRKRDLDKTIKIQQLTDQQDIIDNALENRTVKITCEEDNIMCHEINCAVVFPPKQTFARVLLTMEMNISLIKKPLMGLKDILFIKSEGIATILDNIDNTELSPSVNVYSTFVSSTPERKVALWLIILSIVLGLLLLTLLIYGLVKVGFFERKKKKELALLRQESKRQSQIKTTALEEPMVEDEIDLDMGGYTTE